MIGTDTAIRRLTLARWEAVSFPSNHSLRLAEIQWQYAAPDHPAGKRRGKDSGMVLVE